MRTHKKRAEEGLPIIGICGGCQILGQDVLDPYGIESDLDKVAGLGLLPFSTTMERKKWTTQAKVTMLTDCLGIEKGQEFEGYEIHMGRLLYDESCDSEAFTITERNQKPCRVFDGAISSDIFGTLIHGLFDNDEFRRPILTHLANKKGFYALKIPP